MPKAKSKQSLNKQQSARIQKNQSKFRDSALEASKDGPNTQEGLVLAGFGQHAEIETQEGARLHCSLRKNMGTLVAGDRVLWQALADGRGIVLGLLPRNTLLSRPDKRSIAKPVAANISQLMIILAPKPEPSWLLLDSYLVLAECLHLKATIVLNKMDLAHADIEQELCAYQEALNYPLLFTSQENRLGLHHLESALIDNCSVFVGQSGVGKSSLIAGILPHEQQIEQGSISKASELGCHTTSNSRLYHLPKGGSLIDSPGIREFNLWQMQNPDLLYGFRELRKLAPFCQFRNCEHRDSPGCAILEALKAKAIAPRRYENYLRIVGQLRGLS